MSQAAPKATSTQRSHVIDGLGPAAGTLPHGPATVDGLLNHEALCTSAQRAWLASCTAVADGL